MFFVVVVVCVESKTKGKKKSYLCLIDSYNGSQISRDITTEKVLILHLEITNEG